MLHRRLFAVVLLTSFAVSAAGCCCPCGGFIQGFNAAGGGGFDDDIDSVDVTDEEKREARKNANAALNKVNYGNVKTLSLSKAGDLWTADGNCGGLTEGSTVGYEVQFHVTLSGDTYYWKVKRIKIEGDQIYPKPK